MSKRSFYFVLALCAFMVLIAISPFGSIFGFAIAIAIAFFVAPIGFGLEALFGKGGFAVDRSVIIYGATAAYCIFVASHFWRAWRRYRATDLNGARQHAARGVIFASLAAAAILSVITMADAWPA